MASKKDTLELIKEAEGRGWACTMTRSGHYKLTRPGHDTVFLSGTASDHRSVLNERANIKRAERKAEAAKSGGGK